MTVKERAIYIAPQTSLSHEPSADGSGYEQIPAVEIGDIKDEKGPIAMDYFTGRDWPHGTIMSVDGGEVEISVPDIGLSAAAGDGATPPGTPDWYAKIMRTILGAPTAVGGEGVASLAGTALGLDTDVLDEQDVACLVEAGLPSSGPRAVFVPIDTDNQDGTYVLAWDPGVAFTNAAVAYGFDRYRPVFPNAETFALVYVFDASRQFTLYGCKPVAWSFELGDKGAIRHKLRIRFDSMASTSKASLPAFAPPAVTPAKAAHSAIFLDGVALGSKKTTVDMGLEVQEDESHGGVNGRAGFRLLRMRPKVTIEPLWQSALRDARRQENGDTGLRSVLIQLAPGDANVAGGVLNTKCHYFGQMLVMEESPSADGADQRQTVTFGIHDKVTHNGAAFHPVQHFRC